MFSPDGEKIIWKPSSQKTPEEIKEYKELLAENLVAPTHMEVWIANAMVQMQQQVTDLSHRQTGAPILRPDGKHFIFCSNHEYKRGFPFNMYIANIDGREFRKYHATKDLMLSHVQSGREKDLFFCSKPKQWRHTRYEYFCVRLDGLEWLNY
jgi:Tol biopolymer transport system component